MHHLVHRTILTAALLLFVLLGIMLCTGCGSSSESTAPLDTSDFLLPEAPGTDTMGNDTVAIDASNVDQGYVCLKYKGSNSKVKLQIKKDGDTYTYTLNKSDDYQIFPLTGGDGSYDLEVYENVYDNQYALAYATSLDVSLADERRPFLYPNYYVPYGRDDQVVNLTMDKTSGSSTQLEAVEDVYDYVIGHVEYDHELASSVTDSYVPDLDRVISSRKGICLDYASLMTAMLRIRNIPTKLVVGYKANEYHAWISVYISDVGWVDDIIKFEGDDWTLMDPTVAASGGDGSKSDYEENQDQYHALYFY